MNLTATLTVCLGMAAIGACGNEPRPSESRDNGTSMRVTGENVTLRVAVSTHLPAARFDGVAVVADGREARLVELAQAERADPDSPEEEQERAAAAAEDRRQGSAELAWEAPRELLTPTTLTAIDSVSGQLLVETELPWTYCTGEHAAAARSALVEAWKSYSLEYYGVVEGEESWIFMAYEVGCRFSDPQDDYSRLQ